MRLKDLPSSLGFLVTAGLISLALIAASPASAAPPTITSTSAGDVTTTSAVLMAEVNPEGKAAKYHFEYGPADCSAAPCTATPEVNLKKGEAPVTVEAAIAGLTPGTTYHFRLLAKNTEAATGPDTTFSTFNLPPSFGPCPNEALRTGPSARLPDCRAYEQASPLDKNGG